MQIPVLDDLPRPADKAFALLHPAHVFNKLVWEFANLKAAATKERPAELFLSNVPAYHAFNFAVTAWHLVDWVWAAIHEKDRECLKEFFGCIAMDKKAHLFDAIARKYRCIHLCGQIANGSKHRELWPSVDDPNVKVNIVWEGLPGRAGELRCNDPIVTYKRRLVIRDGTADLEALEVFREVVRTWSNLLGAWGFIEDRLIGPDYEPPPWA
jgi:hypothetical protein